MGNGDAALSNASTLANMRDFAKRMRALPATVAIKVAAAAAPVLTELVQATFAASETPYGLGWTTGDDGQVVTLHKSGRLAQSVAYVAIGTRLRMKLGTSYAKYQVGRRPIAPRQGAPLPASYAAALAKAASDVIRTELGR